ncbi:flagellar basal-body rod protein FlgG [Gemmatimonas sp.]|jgi:flagellar basal-body rod protein FlgG|uniref:flagellar basal-body rod protein FlgG n=1 Tax=Gemmatimonas sp. TaxID=1962908 RepID=UPI0037BEF1C1
MNPALRAAATGMMAQQTRTEVIANNLANVNTAGFKRSRAQFEDLLYQTIQGSQVIGGTEAETLPAIQVGRGTRLAGVQRLHEQGPIEQTGRNLDVAVEGEGFFQVQLPNGELGYTRDGSLQISDQGVLVTSAGYAVQPPIRIPVDSSELTISNTGVVSVRRGTDLLPSEVGRIELARFANPSGLLNLGQNLLAPTTASGLPIVGFPNDEGMGRLQQGSLEGSNVQIVQEMVEMIAAQRAYEINSKSIKTADEMGQIANNIVN